VDNEQHGRIGRSAEHVAGDRQPQLVHALQVLAQARMVEDLRQPPCGGEDFVFCHGPRSRK